MTEYLRRDEVLSDADIITVQTKEYGTIEVVPVEYLADLLTADVAEVKHGEWSLKYEGVGHYWECSECGFKNCVMPRTNYCPHCGAKMDDEKGKQS